MLGPNNAVFDPGPRYHTWRSSHAVGDDVVFISREDPVYQQGTYRVGIWGWSQRGSPGWGDSRGLDARWGVILRRGNGGEG